MTTKLLRLLFPLAFLVACVMTPVSSRVIELHNAGKSATLAHAPLVTVSERGAKSQGWKP